MNFDGCSPEWKESAEGYLRAAYAVDWSPEAMAKKDEEEVKLNDVTNSTRGTTSKSVAKRHGEATFPAKKKARKPPPTSGFSAFSSFVAIQAGGTSNVDEVDEDMDEDAPNILSEVEKYLAMPAMPSSRNGKDTCPLEWWAGHQYEIPHLAKMARQFLALPASSAGCERLFSAAGSQHDDLKKNVKETTLAMQLEVKCNIPD